MQPDAPKEPADAPKQPGLRIVQVYLSTAHFEHGANALAFPPSHKVTVRYGVRAEAHGANDGKAAIIKLQLSTVEEEESESLYKFHAEMTGIVEAESETPHMSIHEYVSKVGVAMLFPFLREAVASLTGRGRFGAIYLKPFNVHALELQEVPAAEAATTE